MIEAPAEVVRVADGHAWVRISERQGGCGRCDEPGGCRSIRIADVFGAPKQVFALPDPFGLQPGDRVRVSIPHGAPLRAALLSYGLGALLLLVGATLGSVVATSAAANIGADLGAAMGALGGLALAVTINRVLARSRHWRGGLSMSLRREQAACGYAQIS